jgi:hypothetical protein
MEMKNAGLQKFYPPLPSRVEGRAKANPETRRSSGNPFGMARAPLRFLKNGLNENEVNGTAHSRIPAMRGKR